MRKTHPCRFHHKKLKLPRPLDLLDPVRRAADEHARAESLPKWGDRHAVRRQVDAVRPGRESHGIIEGIDALLIVPTMFAPHANSRWVAVAIVSLAAASHQWWSANIFTTASDMFPRHAIGSVVGIGGFFGAAGGFVFQRVTGHVLQTNGNNYTPIFLVCGFAYVTALLIIHLLVPRLEPAVLRERTAA